MADVVTIEIVVSSTSRLLDELQQIAVDATEAGAKIIVDEHMNNVSDWGPGSMPEFTVDAATVNKDFVERIVRATGQRWWWINDGTKPVTIIAPAMAYPWNEPDTSYNSSYEPKFSESGDRGGSGAPFGRPGVFTKVENRSIHPRDFIGKVIAAVKDRVMNTMQSYF